MKKTAGKTNNLTMRLVGPPGAKAHLYRWNPGPALRAKGFKGVDLWADGAAFTAEELSAVGFDESFLLRHRGSKPLAPSDAMALAGEMNAFAKNKRPGADLAIKEGGQAPQPARARARHLVYDDLFTDYLASEDFKTKAPTTRENYKKSIRFLRPVFGPSVPLSLTAELLEDWYYEECEERGHSTAHYDYTILRRALNWAQKRQKWVGKLPHREMYTNMGFEKPGARLRVGLPSEIDALMLAFEDPDKIYAETETPKADRVLRPRLSGADALVQMLWTCCRVNDGLIMREEAIDGGWLTYAPNKSRRLKPDKTERLGVILRIPILGAYKERLPLMIRRKRAIFQGDAPYPELIIEEAMGKPYWRESRTTGVRRHRRFNQVWRDHRALAGKIEPRLIGKASDRFGRPVPGFNAQDCRDTAVSRLALAGCDITEISSWHGSDLEYMVRLAKAYLEIGDNHAERAGEKLAKMAASLGLTV